MGIAFNNKITSKNIGEKIKNHLLKAYVQIIVRV